jgi:hypothetical protein
MDATLLPRLLTPMDVGMWLSLPTRDVKRMARRGEIPCLTLPSGDLLFDPEELAAWVKGLRAPSGGVRDVS